jgi:hypothetical protein
MLKAAWHWGSDSIVINDPLGGPGFTPLYVGLPSVRGCVDGDHLFSPFLWEGSLSGDLTNVNEWINHWLWTWSISLHRDPVGEHGRGLIYWGLWGADEAYIKKRPRRWASLSIRALLGNLLGGGLFAGTLKEKERAYLGFLFLDPEDIKVKSDGHLELEPGTGLPWAYIRLWGTKGLFIRCRCIGTVRAGT